MKWHIYFCVVKPIFKSTICTTIFRRPKLLLYNNCFIYWNYNKKKINWGCWTSQVLYQWTEIKRLGYLKNCLVNCSVGGWLVGGPTWMYICAHLFQINESLFGEINFLSQTGPFSIPLHCTIKKCDVSSCHSTITYAGTMKTLNILA